MRLIGACHGWCPVSYHGARGWVHGRFLARELPAYVFEHGIAQRLVIIEFDSVAQAKAAHDSPAYQEALRVLGNAAERDFRIVPGMD